VPLRSSAGHLSEDAIIGDMTDRAAEFTSFVFHDYESLFPLPFRKHCRMSNPDLEILAYEETELGPVCLRRRKLLSDPGIRVVEMTLNHEFLMSSLNSESEQRLAASAIHRHAGKGLSVLVGGLGLGYTARAALASPNVATVVAIEFLPCVISWLTRELIPTAPQLNSDPRFHVTQGDVYQTLKNAPVRHYDVILIDVDHSPEERLNEQNATFYSEESLRATRKHLAADGILAIWSCDESEELRSVLQRVFGNVAVETVTHFNRQVQETVTDYLYFCRNASVSI
jgi:spermidine synthase